MRLNPNQFKSALSSVLILAFPGAIFSAGFIAIAARFVLPYDWTWSLCMVLGAILCTTDAVAIVALLNKAGAPSRLSYLVVGESLLNDGTALVLYNLLFTLIRNGDSSEQSITVTQVVVYFARVIVISPLLGLAFGFGALFFVGLANRRMLEGDTTIQMAVTICCAYLSFFVGEAVLHVSGVICCVVAGLVLSNFAPPLILHQHVIHSVWSALEWVGNTLIFILAGLIIGARGFLYFETRDILCVFVTYGVVMLSRAAMMTLCFPILSRIGNKCTVHEALFVTWGGLRGAVSMAIALSLAHSVDSHQTVVSVADSNRMFVLVGGTAALTLVVNATLSSGVLGALGLTESSSSAQTLCMQQYVKRCMHRKASRLLQQVCGTSNTIDGYSCSRQLVISYCSIFSGQVDESASESLTPDRDSSHSTLGTSERSLSENPPLQVNTAVNSRHSSVNQVVNSAQSSYKTDATCYPDLLWNDCESSAQLRRAFLEVVRVNYWKQINSGKLPRKSTATLALLNSIDVAMEAHRATDLNDWSVLLASCASLSIVVPHESHIESIQSNVAARTPERHTTLMFESATQVSSLHHSSPQQRYRFPQWGSFYAGHRKGQLSLLTQHDSLVAEPEAAHGQGSVLSSQFLSNSLTEYRTAKRVYMLTSFIEAHEYAQHRISHFVGNTLNNDSSDKSVTASILDSSRDQVRQARAKLSEIDSNVIALQVSKQTARWILHVQEDMVAEFQREGVLLERDAALLLGEVQRDLSRLGSVEWSSIVMAKMVNKLESLMCDVCCVIPMWCGSKGADTQSQCSSEFCVEQQLHASVDIEMTQLSASGGDNRV
eukprot:gene23864-30140_t